MDRKAYQSKSVTKCKLHNGLYAYLAGLFLVGCSSALPTSASSMRGKCKPILGLKIMCKLKSGFCLTECQLILGRYTLTLGCGNLTLGIGNLTQGCGIPASILLVLGMIIN